VTRYAEVIGDPIAHSLSPAIHRHWLEALGAAGDYRSTRVPPDELGPFLESRRGEPLWLGCNVTAPHKQAVMPFLDHVTTSAAQAGAVNCVYRQGERLLGANTDVEGIDRALAGIDLRHGKVVLIGAGGAARAAIAYLASKAVAEIVLLVREPAQARELLRAGIRAAPLNTAGAETGNARLIVNASPLGMAGAAPMPAAILTGLARAEGAAVMDMVYKPLQTPLLAAANRAGLKTVDGLEMLIGQARRGFALFFGIEPPTGGDGPLRAVLTGGRA